VYGKSAVPDVPPPLLRALPNTLGEAGRNPNLSY